MMMFVRSPSKCNLGPMIKSIPAPPWHYVDKRDVREPQNWSNLRYSTTTVPPYSASKSSRYSLYHGTLFFLLANPPRSSLLSPTFSLMYLHQSPVHQSSHWRPRMWTRPHLIAAFPRVPTLKRTNDIPLTRRLLKFVLKDLSERLYLSFGRQVRLVVHGGAVMVLHPSFTHRESTQDVDYIHRSFAKEYRALGYTDAGEQLRSCIAETAVKFNLGADWMNAHSDTTLPLALECVCVSSAPP
jgi:hypothetical protein